MTTSSEKKNYITPEGFERLKEEYQTLFRVERPKLVETIAWAASNGDRSENADYIYGKRRLREIDRRLRYLTQRLETAVVVDPSQKSSNRVVFGSTVKIEDEAGNCSTYTIVGEDETDAARSKISWLSPVAQALIGKAPGDEVIIKRPAGDMVVTVLSLG